MSQIIINTGNIANDGTGAPLRTAFNDTNNNFTQIFNAGPVGSNIKISNNTIQVTNTNGNLRLATNGIGSIVPAANFVPDVPNARYIGAPSNRFNTIYSQYLDAAVLTSSGNAYIAGNLFVTGNVVTVDYTNANIANLTMVLAGGSANAVLANNAGIVVHSANANLLYNNSANSWISSIAITAPNFVGDGSQLTNVIAQIDANDLLGDTLRSTIVFSNLTSFGEVVGISAVGDISTTGNIYAEVIAGNTITGNFAGDGSNIINISSTAIVGSVPFAINANSAYTANLAALATQAINADTALFAINANLAAFANVATSAQTANAANYAVQSDNANSAVVAGMAYELSPLANLSITGNITTSGYFLGNGSQLTGIIATADYSNANVAAYLPTYSGNVNDLTFVGGAAIQGPNSGNGSAYLKLMTPYDVRLGSDDGDVEIWAGNPSKIFVFEAAGNLRLPSDTSNVNYSNGVSILANINTDTLTAGNVSVTGNIYVENNVSVSGNILSGNIIGQFGSIDNLSVAGNITAGNINTAGSGGDITMSSGNITGANNVTASYFVGDGSQLTNLPVQPGTYGNANVAAYLPTYTGNLAGFDVSVTGNVYTDGKVLHLGETSANGITANSAGIIVGNDVAKIVYDNTVFGWTVNQGWHPTANTTYNLGRSNRYWNNFWTVNINATDVAIANTIKVNNSISVVGNIQANVVRGNYIYGDGGNISNVNVSVSEIVNGSSVVSIPTADDNVLINVAGSHTWTFGTNGDLNVPNDILARESNDLNIKVFSPSADPGVAFSVQNRQVDIGNAKTTQFDVNTNKIVLTTDFSGNKYEWTFDNTGNLVLPNNGTVNSFITNNNNNLQLISNAGAELDYYDSTDENHFGYISIDGSGAYIVNRSNVAGNISTVEWDFNPSGNLTVPGPIVLSNAGSGTYSVIQPNQNPPYGGEPYGIEMLTTTDDPGVFSSVSSGPDYVTLLSTNAGNANIIVQGGYGITFSTSNALGGSIKEWSFVSGGDSYFPGNINADQFIGNGAQLTDLFHTATSIAIGANAGANAINSIAIGVGAGDRNSQGANAIAIGSYAGANTQGDYSIAIGRSAGYDTQGQDSIAFGRGAGNSQQGEYAFAAGFNAGTLSQGANSIAIGPYAAANVQSTSSVAVGYYAANDNQGANAVAIGRSAGHNNQGANAVSIGLGAGNTSQGTNAIAIGINAGNLSQGDAAIAIGRWAGNSSQGGNAVAVGRNAGNITQADEAIAIGHTAGSNVQGTAAVAIGWQAGSLGQSPYAVAIGAYAGNLNQGSNSVAIGAFAGYPTTANNAVVINGLSSALNAPNSGFYIAPVRNDTGNTTNVVYYNTSTNEMTYGPASGGGSYGNANVVAYGQTGWAGNIIPSANSTYSLGNATNQWKSLYVSNATVYIGNVPLSTSGNSLTVGGNAVVTSSSNTANVTGNLTATGYVSATGNVVGNYILGNGSQLTGITANYSNTNVVSLMTAFGSNTISTSGNITAGNVAGNISITGNVTGSLSNVELVAGGYTWTYNNTGNMVLPGNTFAVNYANGAQVTLGGTYSNSNVSAFLAAFGSNSMSTGGNVTANALVLKNTDDFNQITFSSDGGTTNNGYVKVDGGTNMVIGSASNFSVKRAGSDRISVTDTTADFMATTNVRIQSNKSGSAYTWTFDSTGNLAAPGNASITGNVTGGNILTAGIMSSTGNAVHGNILTSGLLSVSGNILANGQINSAIYTGGNISWSANNQVDFQGAIKVGGTGRLLSPGGAASITLDNNGFSAPRANVTTLNVAGNANITGTSSTGIGALTAGATNTLLSNTVAGFTANVNNYTQVTFQNKSTGTDATADFILTADNGDDTTNYSDFGIINSGYDANTPTNSLGNIVYAADTYLYAQGNLNNTSQSGGNLVIGTTVSGKSVKIFAGGNTASALVANFSNTGVSVAGNVTASNFTGNISITGNVTGTSANVTLVAGSYSYVFDNTGNLTLPGNSDLVFGGNTTLTSTAGSNGNITINPDGTGLFVVTAITPAVFGNTVSVTGNLSSTSNIRATGTVYGFELTSTESIGDEGGQINLAVPQTNTTLANSVTVDVFQNKIRFFEGSANAKGLYIDLSDSPAGVGGEITYKNSGYVNAGVFVTLDNIKAQLTTSGQRGLSIATTTGSISAMVGGTYGLSGGAGGASSNGVVTYNTTPSGSLFGWSFSGQGDAATYILTDITNSRTYRITLQIGGGYTNNFISIERL